jgi:hypothetical protein
VILCLPYSGIAPAYRGWEDSKHAPERIFIHHREMKGTGPGESGFAQVRSEGTRLGLCTISYMNIREIRLLLGTSVNKGKNVTSQTFVS